jgi:hypothetical protein
LQETTVFPFTAKRTIPHYSLPPALLLSRDDGLLSLPTKVGAVSKLRATMKFAPSASQYREREFVSVPEGPTPRLANIQNWPKPRPADIQNNQRRLSIGRRMSRAFARCAIVLLIGIGATLAWQSYGDEAIEMVKTEAPSLAWLLPVSKAKPPPDGQSSAAVVNSAELVKQLKPIALDLAILRRSVEQLGVKVEQLAAKQDQMSHAIVLRSVEQGPSQKLSSLPQRRIVPPRKPAQPTEQ